jgi:hypothetical protein
VRYAREKGRPAGPEAAGAGCLAASGDDGVVEVTVQGRWSKGGREAKRGHVTGLVRCAQKEGPARRAGVRPGAEALG